MKKLMIAAAALMVSVAAYGQGQFIFNNRLGTDVNAKFQLDSDAGTTSSLAGNAYTVQLLGGKAGTAVGQLTPLGVTNFRTGAAAGFVNQISPTVAGVTDGQDAIVLVRIFAGATATGTALKDFGPYTIKLTEAPATPNALPLGTTALIVPGVIPEPATLALGALGLGALLMIRRRK